MLIRGIDTNVFRLQLGKIDSGDGLSVDDQQHAIRGEDVRKDRARLGAFNDRIKGVDDGFQPIELLNLFDHGRDRSADGLGTSGDQVCHAPGEAGGCEAQKYHKAYYANQQGDQDD